MASSGILAYMPKLYSELANIHQYYVHFCSSNIAFALHKYRIESTTNKIIMLVSSCYVITPPVVAIVHLKLRAVYNTWHTNELLS